MQRLMKFLHVMGAIGMIGALAAILVVHASLPPATDVDAYVQMREVLDDLARYLLFPSLGLVLFSGLMSMSLGKFFTGAPWAWAKLALGVVMFEGTLFAVQGPMQREAELARRVMEGSADAAELGLSLQSEWGSVWVILLVAVANVVLGVWRPRFQRPRAQVS